MNYNWKLNDFVFAGIVGAIVFAIAFLLGSGIILATGIPATGGIANILAVAIFMTIAKHIRPIFGFATLALLITFALAIPTIIGGTPGIYKIVVGVLIGLTFDVFVLLMKNSYKAYLLGGAIGAMVSIVSIYFAMVLLDLPGVDKLQPLLMYLVPLQGINGMLGAWIGNKIYYNKLKEIPAIKKFINK